MKYKSLLLCVLLSFPGKLFSQFPVNYQYTLLPNQVVDEILGYSSGDLAMHHINELAPYTRPRTDEELKGTLAESAYIMSKLKEYGLSNYSLDIAGSTTTWRAIEGSIWETGEKMSKLADISDVPEMLVEGSQPADLTAQLIWVGEGMRDWFTANQSSVKGKIVVTSSSPGSVHSAALAAGALGTISFYSPRPYIDPIQIPNTGIGRTGFAFMLPPREGMLLRDRLTRRENITVRVKVKSITQPVTLQVPQCLIEGKDPAAPEIIITAHLFEGYVKMGANDNMSGSAVILEVAHILNQLITEGRIAKPERSIRFLWVPEFSGTIPWVNNHLAEVRNALCNINLDMVGLRLRDSRSFMYLHRSGFSTASFANDVMESYFRYVGETNVEGITDNLGRRGFSRRIVSPTGTDDPFYYRISSLHGSSDNAVFNDWSINVPGMKLITWPDDYYHSSEDNPDKCDPTQLRRVIFITAAGAYTLASANPSNASRLASESYSLSMLRLGAQEARSGDMIWTASKENITSVYKRAVYNLEGATLAEKAAVDRLLILGRDQMVVAVVNSTKSRLDKVLDSHIENLKDIMKSRCKALGIPDIQISNDEVEKNASRVVPAITQNVRSMGYGGDSKFISEVLSEFRRTHPYNGIFNVDEVAGLADGKRTLLQIKKMIDAQFERETPLQDIINYYQVLKEAGLMQY
ncbi:MAG: DUF4910 domain-containing protein [Bacteroidales bacterium]